MLMICASVSQSTPTLALPELGCPGARARPEAIEPKQSSSANDSNDVRGVMRLPIAALLWLIAGTGLAIAQAGTGGGSTGGGSASPGAAAPGGAGRTAPAAPNAPNSTSPGQPAPGVANTPVDPGRNNVDVNPPTKRWEGASPGTQRTPMAAPTGPNAHPAASCGSPTPRPPAGPAPPRMRTATAIRNAWRCGARQIRVCPGKNGPRPAIRRDCRRSSDQSERAALT